MCSDCSVAVLETQAIDMLVNCHSSKEETETLSGTKSLFIDKSTEEEEDSIDSLKATDFLNYCSFLFKPKLKLSWVDSKQFASQDRDLI